ncbi:MAG: glycine cleavage system aminomethyltransferase GcvT [Candidatus Anammoxibacter sp.]
MAKKTPLYDTHKEMGAKIVNFGGWDMPVQYTGLIGEHLNTRKNAGLFDISHMGEIEISGKDSFKFVQRLITNDISCLSVGGALYTPICDEKGGFVDDIIVYMIKPAHFLLVVNASNTDKDIKWINKISEGFNVEINDVSADTADLALQGPEAENILKKITKTDISKIKYFGFTYGDLNGTKTLISRTGYTGEDGFELYFHSSFAVEIWNLLLDVGKSFGLTAVGLGARDTLRLEACLRLYGNDIDDTINPFEAGLKWTVNLNKDDFIGKDALVAHAGNIKRKLIAFEMIGKPIARHNYSVFKNGHEIGSVTSGTFSPSLKKPIGMAFVNTEYANIGEMIEVLIRNKRYEAQIVSMPFVEKRTKCAVVSG